MDMNYFSSWDSMESYIGKRRAQKGSHMPIEEPEPYTYDAMPIPEPKSAMMYTPDGKPTRNHVVSDASLLTSIDDTEVFQQDIIRETPYDLDTRGERSTSFMPKVNGFVQPPTKAQWQYQSLTRIPSKIHHNARTTNIGTSMGVNHVISDRDPSRVLVNDVRQVTRIEPQAKDSGDQRVIEKIDYINPVHNIREPQRVDSGAHTSRPVAPMTKHTGPSRFLIRSDPKYENKVDPKRHAPITVDGRTDSENFVFKYKTQPSTMEPGQRSQYRTRPRSEYEDIELSRKQDQKELSTEKNIPYTIQLRGGDVREAKQARYIPMLTPKLATASVIPMDIGATVSQGQVPVVQRPYIQIDNKGSDGLDLTGASHTSLVGDYNITPQIIGIR